LAGKARKYVIKTHCRRYVSPIESRTLSFYEIPFYLVDGDRFVWPFRPFHPFFILLLFRIHLFDTALKMASSDVDESKELRLVNNVELKIALADTDEKLQRLLGLYLPPLVLKLASPHGSVRNKVGFAFLPVRCLG